MGFLEAVFVYYSGEVTNTFSIFKLVLFSCIKVPYYIRDVHAIHTKGPHSVKVRVLTHTAHRTTPALGTPRLALTVNNALWATSTYSPAHG